MLNKSVPNAALNTAACYLCLEESWGRATQLQRLYKWLRRRNNCDAVCRTAAVLEIENSHAFVQHSPQMKLLCSSIYAALLQHPALQFSLSGTSLPSRTQPAGTPYDSSIASGLHTLQCVPPVMCRTPQGLHCYAGVSHAVLWS
jgi:hypothetical protein